MRLRNVLDLVRDLAATPGDAVLRSRTLRTLSEALSVASPDSARYFLPGTSTPASEIYTVGNFGPIAPGGNSLANPFQISRPGVAVGLLITGRGLGGLTIEEEAANLEWQLTRENTEQTAANISSNAPGSAGGSGFASVANCSRFVPWIPLLIPARGSGTWNLEIRNIHPGEPISAVANLAFLRGDDAFYSACAFLSIDPEQAR